MRRCIICIFSEAVTFDVWEEIGSQNVRLYGEQLACFWTAKPAEKMLSHSLERCVKWAKLLLCQEVFAVSVFPFPSQAEELLRDTAAQLSLTVHTLSEEECLAFLTASFKDWGCGKTSACCYLNGQRPALLCMEDGALVKLFHLPDDFTSEGLAVEELLVTGYSAGQIGLLATVLLVEDIISISALSRLTEMVSKPLRETSDLLDKLFHGGDLLLRDLLTLRELCQRLGVQQIKLIPWNPSASLTNLQKVMI